MPSRRIVLQLILLTCIPLHQSLLASSNRKICKYPNHKCNNRNTVLFAGRNPFKRNESNANDSTVERDQRLIQSKSALFLSLITRGRSINLSKNEGILSNNMHPDDVGAVRNASVLGGILSIVFTRDIWFAVSSFLLINIFASQSNSFGVFIRSIGEKMDNLQLEISRKRMLLRIVNFLKAVNEASSLQKIPAKQKEAVKNTSRATKNDRSPVTPHTVFPRDREAQNRIGRGRNYSYSDSSEIEEPDTDRSDWETDTHSSDCMIREHSNDGNPTSKAELMDLSVVTVTASHSTHTVASSLDDFDVVSGTLVKESPSIPDIEHNSEAVIRATIEVQAAADAASARLKAWILQQKQAEEEKKIMKLSIATEITRVRDLPRLRDELLMHMSAFVSGNITERRSLTVATVNAATATTANSSYPVYLSSFLCRAIESSAGSINDFILVLTSPGEKRSFLPFLLFFYPRTLNNHHKYQIILLGKNNLKQRYRDLAKEFHPDSGRNLDLPDSAVNSLMANLTGHLTHCVM